MENTTKKRIKERKKKKTKEYIKVIKSGKSEIQKRFSSMLLK